MNEDNGNIMHVQLQKQLEALSSCKPNLAIIGTFILDLGNTIN